MRDEGGVPAANLEPRRDGVENGIVQLIGHTKGIDARHRLSLPSDGAATGYASPTASGVSGARARSLKVSRCGVRLR